MRTSFFHAVSLLLCTVLTLNVAQAADEPVLQLQLANQKQKLALSNLLRHPSTQTITIPDDPTYKRRMTYQAIPLSAILRDIRGFDALQFKATDGFVATIPVSLLRSASEPWLALEPQTRPWPAVAPGKPSAGAFYLVWLMPEKSGVSPEQWPFQIESIADVEPLEKRYPQIAPQAEAGSAAWRGMHLFTVNCASCHRINGGGDGTVGPDLNLPFNPTEYFHEDFLRRLIRDSSSVRNWPQRVMPAFSETVLSESQLDDLLAYLRQMAKQKATPQPQASPK